LILIYSLYLKIEQESETVVVDDDWHHVPSPGVGVGVGPGDGIGSIVAFADVGNKGRASLRRE
jgi:hypothetical protein